MNLDFEIIKELVEKNGREKLYLEESKNYFSNLIENQFENDERAKRIFQLAIKEDICCKLIKLITLNETKRLLEIESIKQNFVDLNGLSIKSASVVDLLAEVLFNLSTIEEIEVLEWIDQYGVIYNYDKTELINGGNVNQNLIEYNIIQECKIIRENAFLNSKLQKINIPEGIIKIGDDAFSYCNLIQEIIIPNSVSIIGNNAFCHCTQLHSIIADSSYFKSIDGVLFTADLKKIIVYPYKDGISTYKIPDGVTSIGKNAFMLCNLRNLYIPSSLTTIEDSAFSFTFFNSIFADSDYFKSKDNILYSADFKTIIYYCHRDEDGRIESSIEIPYGVETIGKFAFSRPFFKRIFIPDSVITIGNNAFSLCNDLETVFISENVRTIGDFAFSYCFKLQFIHIPEGVTTIGDSVFSNCMNLKSIHLPESVNCIGNDIFNSCQSLTQIHIPKYSEAFFQKLFKEDYHKFLTEDKKEEYSTEQYPSNEGTWTDEYGIIYTANKKKLIIIPTTLSNYKINPECNVICDKALTGDNDIYITENITLIGERAFSGINLQNIFANSPYYQSIDGVLYTADLKTIVKYPTGKGLITDMKTIINFPNKEFYNEYEIPYGVKKIGKYAFFNCIGIQSLHISETVNHIDFLGLNGCFGLKNIFANNSYFKSIDGILFSSDLMKIITFPSGKDITEYKIPNGVTAIGFHAFAYCSNLQSVYIPESVKDIGIMAFYECKQLNYIHIDNNYFKSIEGVLYSADLKTIIKYPEGKNDIEFKIDEGVLNLHNSVFTNCAHLKVIHIPDSVISIDNMAFDNTELQNIYIPKGTTVKFKSILNNKYHILLKEKSIKSEDNQFIKKLHSLFYNKSLKNNNLNKL